MQQRHKNLDVSGRICITPNNKVFLGGHHHQAAAALACLIRVRKKTKTPKLFDHSSFTLRIYQIPFKTGTFDHEFISICIHGCLWHPINLPFRYEGALAIIKFSSFSLCKSSRPRLKLLDHDDLPKKLYCWVLCKSDLKHLNFCVSVA